MEHELLDLNTGSDTNDVAGSVGDVRYEYLWKNSDLDES